MRSKLNSSAEELVESENHANYIEKNALMSD